MSNAVNAVTKFYKYVNKGMSVKVKLTDAGSGADVWEGTLKDGDLIHLGNDHPDGYKIYFKINGIATQQVFVKLKVLKNLEI